MLISEVALLQEHLFLKLNCGYILNPYITILMRTSL